MRHRLAYVAAKRQLRRRCTADESRQAELRRHGQAAIRRRCLADLAAKRELPRRTVSGREESPQPAEVDVSH